MKNCFLTVFASLILILFSCSDPVFYLISQEVEPLEPRINGSAANFAIFKNPKAIDDPDDDIVYMYTASGSTLHRYYYKDETDENIWEKGPNPGGRILQLASTGSKLYALCNEGYGLNVVLRRFDNSEWTDIGIGTEIFEGTLQYIFSARDKLFIGGVQGTRFSILYIDEDTSSDTEVKNLPLEGEGIDEKTSAELSGAAFDGTNYYLSTIGAGVFKSADPSSGAVLLSGSEKILFTAMISLQNDANTIAAITRGGEIYTVGESIAKVEGISMGEHMSTGALAIWRDRSHMPRLLLAGRQNRLDYSVNSGYTYGYLEIEIDENGIVAGTEFREPGKRNPTSAADNEQYTSSIGKYPVNHIFQAPPEVDSKMTLFASTQKNGVFSYRLREKDQEENWQWNAEE